MFRSKESQQIGDCGEALLFDPGVEDVGALVNSVSSDVRLVRAVPGEVSSQLQKLLASGASTIHLLGHGQPGQVKLAGFVLDGCAWESIVSGSGLSNAETGEQCVSRDNEDLATITADRVISKQKLEINFWSCQTGEGIMGKKYTQRVADLCDARVNASSD